MSPDDRVDLSQRPRHKARANGGTPDIRLSEEPLRSGRTGEFRSGLYTTRDKP